MSMHSVVVGANRAKRRYPTPTTPTITLLRAALRDAGFEYRRAVLQQDVDGFEAGGQEQ